MPPVAKAGGPTFRKDVDFITKEDDDERLAVGIVMVPDKADLQHDFVRQETIQQFADQFESLYETGDAAGGIMHAAWPDGWMELERNEVLEQDDVIGGVQAPEGAWVQAWRILHDDLWTLVIEDIISGYSIGAVDVSWAGPFEPGDEDVSNIEIPEDLPDDSLVWELFDGLIREVSTVDIPAVPDAEILDVTAMDKALSDHLGNQDAFIEEAVERGHSEEDAELLWSVLNEALQEDGASTPGKDSLLSRAGKAFLSALSGADDGENKSPEDPDLAEKEGRTLSQENRDALFASIDSQLDVLNDAGIEHGMTRFTDREDVGFDLADYAGRSWGDEEDEDKASTGKNATGGETPDSKMTDDNPDKSLAEDNAERLDSIENQLTDIADKLDDGSNKGDEVATEIERLESELKDLREAAGKSQQLEANTNTESGGRTKADVLGLPGGDN